MYENITYDVLLGRMLKTALAKNKNLDSREGSLLWLGQAPAAVELQNLYIALDNILKETFADTASREYLILRAAERGLTPQPASPAVLELTITPATLSLPLGTRFSIGELNYSVTGAAAQAGVYEITCETAGEAGNEYGAAVIPIEYVAGLETCTVTALLVPGEEEEETELFRKRYFDSLHSQAFGGNRADYIQKVNALPGVGGVKVYRAWNANITPTALSPPEETETWLEKVIPQLPSSVGTWLRTVYQAGRDGLLTVGGTVRLVIIDSTFAAPSADLVDRVQTAIDPIQNAGEGCGLAPIGHVVKVFPIKEEPIDLSFSLVYRRGWAWDDVEPYVREAVMGYFRELAQTWAEQEEPLVLRISQLESRLISLTGILDITGSTINGKPANMTLPADSIPVLSGLNAASSIGT